MPLGNTRKYLLIITSGLAFLLSALCIEILLRFLGITPWSPESLNITVTPGGKFYQTDSLLGYTHIPGVYQVTLHDGYVFTPTHLSNSLRTTGREGAGDTLGKTGEIWIFGCSLSYGWSVNDSETYAWKLQEMFPDYRVVNFAVNGYGTIQSLLQFRETLKMKKPVIAILAYSGIHDIRNTFSRVRRKSLVAYNKLGPLRQPYARLDKKGELHFAYADPDYTHFPFTRWSAISHFLESKYDQFEFRFYKSHNVSEALVRKMGEEAQWNSVPFLVADIWQGKPMLDYVKSIGLETLDITVNLLDTAYNNLPHDGHPNAGAHGVHAEKLANYLEKMGLFNSVKGRKKTDYSFTYK